jgi:hypothetical protein
MYCPHLINCFPGCRCSVPSASCYNSCATIVLYDSICELQIKKTVFFDKIIVFSFMKLISCNRFPLSMSRLKLWNKWTPSSINMLKKPIVIQTFSRDFSPCMEYSLIFSHLAPSRGSWMQSTCSQPISSRFILILSSYPLTCLSQVVSSLHIYRPISCVHSFSSSCMLCVFSPLFVHTNNVRWRIQTMEGHILQLFSLSRYFLSLSLRSK